MQSLTKPRFFVLCKAELHSRLRHECRQWAEQWFISDQLTTLLQQILLEPPSALMLEISTAIKLPKRTLQALLDLGVRWPVIRCGFRPDGLLMGMCQDPPKSDELDIVLHEIAQGNPSWSNPRYRRLALRMHVEGRARLRRSGEEWHPGMIQNIGCGGAFIATFDAWNVGDSVEVELQDIIPNDPFNISAKIASVRPWGTQRGMPGVGLVFPADFSRRLELATAISNPEFLSLPIRVNNTL
jgi:PilZ domain